MLYLNLVSIVKWFLNLKWFKSLVILFNYSINNKECHLPKKKYNLLKDDILFQILVLECKTFIYFVYLFILKQNNLKSFKYRNWLRPQVQNKLFKHIFNEYYFIHSKIQMKVYFWNMIQNKNKIKLLNYFKNW